MLPWPRRSNPERAPHAFGERTLWELGAVGLLTAQNILLTPTVSLVTPLLLLGAGLTESVHPAVATRLLSGHLTAPTRYALRAHTLCRFDHQPGGDVGVVFEDDDLRLGQMGASNHRLCELALRC